MSLLAYSGVSTKVRAMKSHLISDRQLHEMAALEDVRSAADYLKKQPAYADIFSNLDDTKLHRAYIEQLLILSTYRDYTKLYRFSNLAQRRFLDLYFNHYEIMIIKRCLRNVMSHTHAGLDLSVFRDFFERHSRIDLIRLSQVETMPDFFSVLEGSVYAAALNSLPENPPPTLFDYEMRLDMLYFKTLWNTKHKILKQNFGCQLDLLNIQWIYRSLKYYSLSAADIYALLIPVNYKLKRNEIQHMAEAATLEDFFTALEGTYYGSLTPGALAEKPDLDALSEQVMSRIYAGNSRKHPYSIAILAAYLYFKEVEQQKIITTIEGIRYGLGTSEIISLVVKSERGLTFDRKNEISKHYRSESRY